MKQKEVYRWDYSKGCWMLVGWRKKVLWEDLFPPRKVFEGRSR